MPRIIIPSPNSAEVRAIERDLLAMCSADDPWSNFLRGYLKHASRRLAWNARTVSSNIRPGDRWLDIGSFGLEALWLLQHQPSVDIKAVSYEGGELTLDAGLVRSESTDRSLSPRLRIDKADVEFDTLPHDNQSFDLITCFECVEHLRTTPNRMLAEIRRVLRPDGRLLLTTPNILGSRAMIRMLAGKHPQENPRYHRDPRYGIVHPKEYTMKEIIVLLESRGLGVTDSKSMYFRRRSIFDMLMLLTACMTRPLGGLALGLGPQRPAVGDNLFLVAQPHERPQEQWPSLIFEAR